MKLKTFSEIIEAHRIIAEAHNDESSNISAKGPYLFQDHVPEYVIWSGKLAVHFSNRNVYRALADYEQALNGFNPEQIDPDMEIPEDHHPLEQLDLFEAVPISDIPVTKHIGVIDDGSIQTGGAVDKTENY